MFGTIGYTLTGVFLVVTICESVTALECYKCSNAQRCRGEEKDHFEFCSAANAQAMAVGSSFFFPKLNDSLVISENYQCVTLEFTQKGINETHMAKGCMFETKTSLCSLETDISNGNFSCYSCNTNKCNSGVTLGWSFLLMIAGWAVVRLV